MQSINFQPSASHRPQDECDKELQSLEKTFAETCERLRHGFYQGLCRTRAKETIRHSKTPHWQKNLVGKVLDDGKTPVFWAGSGLEVKRALTPEKPWLTSSLPSKAFNWPTQNGPSSRERRCKQPRSLHLAPEKELVECGLDQPGQSHGSPQCLKHHHCPSQNLAWQLLLLRHGLVPGRAT